MFPISPRLLFVPLVLCVLAAFYAACCPPRCPPSGGAGGMSASSSSSSSGGNDAPDCHATEVTCAERLAWGFACTNSPPPLKPSAVAPWNALGACGCGGPCAVACGPVCPDPSTLRWGPGAPLGCASCVEDPGGCATQYAACQGA